MATPRTSEKPAWSSRATKPKASEAGAAAKERISDVAGQASEAIGPEVERLKKLR
ncbi:MAG: hypothetical protein P8L79_02420 [Rhodospirillaceae bacterium]|jgi:hypothetical protein|nr:hypothetical protein [Rhodospirillaceae bacterium]